MDLCVSALVIAWLLWGLMCSVDAISLVYTNMAYGRVGWVFRKGFRPEGKPAHSDWQDVFSKERLGVVQEIVPGQEQKLWVQSQTTFASIAKDEEGRPVCRVQKQKIWKRTLSRSTPI